MIVYHRTDRSSADQILATQAWISRENSNEIYFSTVAVDSAADGYGTVVLAVDIHPDLASLDDEFPDGEQHYRIHTRDLAGLPVAEIKG